MLTPGVAQTNLTGLPMRLFLRCIFYCLLFSPLAAIAQTANFTALPVSGCAPLVVQFTSTSTGNITSYNWNLGNGTTPTLQNPSTTYLTPGTYNVSLTVSGPGGSNTKTVTAFITVYNQPTVNFATIDTAGCPPLQVQFTNTSVPNAPGGMQYSWDFGDGSASTVTTPSHSYTAPGFYSPSLVVTNSYGCSKTLVRNSYIDVYTPPAGGFLPMTGVFCHPPAVVNFTSQSSGTPTLTTAWTFGDGGTGTGAAVTHSYTTAGTYSVKAITTDGHGCKVTVTHATGVVIYPGGSFTVPASGCLYDTIHFANTSPGALSSSWSFGDGGISTNANPTHIYNTAGTFNVRLITDLGGCLDTLTQAITIHPQPGSGFTATPLFPCDTPASIQFTSTGAGVSWSWVFGDGTTGTGANPVHVYHQYGLDSAMLITTSAFGCRDTVLRLSYLHIYGHNLSIVDTPGAGCAPITVHFASQLTGFIPNTPAFTWPFPITSYDWSFGDGSPNSSLDSPIHTYTNPGTFNVTLTVTTGNGCTFSRTIQVMAGTHPVASFYAAPTPVCVKSTVTYTSTSTNVGPGTNYFWAFGDGTTSLTAGVTTSHSYSNPGTYTVTLTVINNGCTDTMRRLQYITVNPPNASFIDSIFCPVSLLTVKFKNQSVGATSQTWAFGDGTGSTAASPPPHTFPGWGTYNTTLNTYNNITGCHDSTLVQLVLVQPITNFSALDTTLCLDDTLRLTATTALPTSFYRWRFDTVYSPQPDTFSSVKYVFPTKGFHTITLITQNIYGCFDTLVKTNYILVSRPVPGFTSSPVTGCTPLNVTFTDTSGYTIGTVPASRYWRYGDGNTGTNNLSTISHSYTAAGLYNVTLIATDNSGCSDSVTKPGYIDAHHPTAVFAPYTATPCIGQSVAFTNGSTGTGALSYAWSFGDGGTSTQPFPNHTYGSVGNYTVSLIVTDPIGCKDTSTVTNLISVTKPHAAFAMSDTLAICPPLLVHFTNNSTGATAYQWAFGNGSPSTLTNPVNTYTAAGTYTVRLVAFNVAGCTDTAYGTVRVLGYAGALSYSPLTGCAPLTVNFTASIFNVPNLVWDFSDGVTAPANGATYSHTYATPGAYVPKLIFSDGSGCVSSSVGLDTIKVDGVDADFNVFPPCMNSVITFSDTSHSYYTALNAWSWNFGNGVMTTGMTTTHTYPTAGTYPVTLIVRNAGGCKDTVTKQVTIYDLPLINGLGDTTVCPFDAAVLTATGGISYVWSPAATLSCSACTSPTASTPLPVAYIVVGTDARGCKNKDTVRVNIQYKTTSTAGPGGEICLGGSYQLTASGAQVYHWSPAATLNNAAIASPVATPLVTTNYMVVATEGSCIADTNFVRVIVHPLPVVQISGDVTVIAGGSVQLIASGSNISQYLWLPDATLSCTACSNPTVTPRATTTYTVVAKNEFGCTDTASTVIHLLCDASQVFIPNTFTPNNDGQNDYFFARGVGLDHIVSFRVYSRWGEVLFEKTGIQLNDERNGWDGTYKGAVLPPDVYVYVMEAICENGEPVRWKGDVTLMR